LVELFEHTVGPQNIRPVAYVASCPHLEFILTQLNVGAYGELIRLANELRI